jgi:hypothetical protein
MATSGSADFSITRNEILQKALERAKILAQGEDMDSEMQNSAQFALNLMTKEWQADGLNLWAVDREVTLFMVKGQQTYSLGTSGTHAAKTVVSTQMRVAGTASDTTLEVDSTTGMTAADNIGIVLSDSTLQWTTISSVTDSDTLVISDALTASSAIDNYIYTYTNKIARPLRVLSARRRVEGGNDVPLEVISREEYNFQANKTANGSVAEVYYDPQLSNGELSVWPTSDTVKDRVMLTTQRPIEDFDASTDNPDYPVEWGNALIWNLAEQLAEEYGKSNNILKRVQMQAIRSKDRVMKFDREDTHILIQPRFY